MLLRRDRHADERELLLVLRDEGFLSLSVCEVERRPDEVARRLHVFGRPLDSAELADVCGGGGALLEVLAGPVERLRDWLDACHRGDHRAGARDVARGPECPGARAVGGYRDRECLLDGGGASLDVGLYGVVGGAG